MRSALFGCITVGGGVLVGGFGFVLAALSGFDTPNRAVENAGFAFLSLGGLIVGLCGVYFWIVHPLRVLRFGAVQQANVRGVRARSVLVYSVSGAVLAAGVMLWLVIPKMTTATAESAIAPRIGLLLVLAGGMATGAVVGSWLTQPFRRGTPPAGTGKASGD